MAKFKIYFDISDIRYQISDISDEVKMPFDRASDETKMRLNYLS